MFFYLMDRKTKIILIISIVLVLLVGVYLYISKDNTKEVDKNQGISIVESGEEDDKPTRTPAVVEDVRESQSDAVKRYLVTVDKIIDKGTKIDYIVTVGVGENAQESIVQANSRTIFYDSKRQSTIGPEGILEGMELVFIGSGSPQIKDMVASLLIVNGSPNIKYSKIKSINKDGDTGGYILELDINKEYLAITDETPIKDGITSTVITDMRRIQEGSGIIYTVKPDFSQQSFGLLYDAEEVILISNP